MLPRNYSSCLVAFTIPFSSLLIIPSLSSIHWRLWFMPDSHLTTVPPCYPAGQRAIKFQPKRSRSWTQHVDETALPLESGTLVTTTEPSVSYQIYTLSLLQLLLPWLIPFFSSLGSTGSIAIGEALTTSYLGWGDVMNWTCSLHFPASSNLFSM